MHFYGRAFFLLLLSLGTPLVDAHHSRSAFSLDEQVTVSGRVTEVGWTNPHYYLSVRDTTNNRDWTFEGHSIPGLVRNGWSKTTFTVGDPVTVVANPNKKGDVLFGLLNSAETAAGELYYSFRPKRSAAPPPIFPSRDFSGTWRLIRSLKANLLTAEGVPEAWELNEKSKRLVQRYSRLDDPSLNCEPRGLPRMLEWPYAQQWRHTPEGISIRIEHAVEERLFGREEAGNKPDVLGLGNSVIVSQSAEELVVRTTGFDAKHWGLNRGLRFICAQNAHRAIPTYRWRFALKT